MYRDLGALHPEVGQVTGSGFNGSGTLISPRWVVTAGHVGMFKTNGRFAVGGVSYVISRVITYPDYRFGGDLHDISLLELASNAAVAPAAILGLPDDSVLLGQTTTWVGLGLGGTGLTGSTGQPGVSRGFTNSIDGFGPEFGLVTSSMFADFDRPNGLENTIPGSSPIPTPLEGNVATGDSGGAVFFDGKLVGVISYRASVETPTNNNSDYGDFSGATRLSLYTNWIQTQTGIVAIPEPSSVLLMATFTVLGLRRRR